MGSVRSHSAGFTEADCSDAAVGVGLVVKQCQGAGNVQASHQ